MTGTPEELQFDTEYPITPASSSVNPNRFLGSEKPYAEKALPSFNGWAVKLWFKEVLDLSKLSRSTPNIPRNDIDQPLGQTFLLQQPVVIDGADHIQIVRAPLNIGVTVLVPLFRMEDYIPPATMPAYEEHTNKIATLGSIGFTLSVGNTDYFGGFEILSKDYDDSLKLTRHVGKILYNKDGVSKEVLLPDDERLRGTIVFTKEAHPATKTAHMGMGIVGITDHTPEIVKALERSADRSITP